MQLQSITSPSPQNHTEVCQQIAKRGYPHCAYVESCQCQPSGTGPDEAFIPPNIVPEEKARRTAPCKHFMRTGTCPLGDACNFIHDMNLELVDAGEGPRVERHCWAHVQSGCYVRLCQYFHPYDTRPYRKYTPCYAWNFCRNRPTCPFRHPEVPSIAEVAKAPMQQQVRLGPVAMLPMNGMNYFAMKTPMPEGGPIYSPSTEARIPNRDPYIPFSNHDLRAIYADERVQRAGPLNPTAPLDALPGPSFEDSPPQVKSYQNNPDPYYPSHQGVEPAGRFDGTSHGVGFIGVNISKAGQSGLYRSNEPSWLAQAQEDAQRKARMIKQPFYRV